MVNIKISNRVLYTFIAVIMIIAIGGVVYAYTNPTTGVGHDADDIGPGNIEGPIAVKGSLNVESQSYESGGVWAIRPGSITENGESLLKCGWEGWSGTCVTICSGWCESPGEPRQFFKCDTGTLEFKTCNTECVTDPYC